MCEKIRPPPDPNRLITSIDHARTPKRRKRELKPSPVGRMVHFGYSNPGMCHPHNEMMLRCSKSLGRWPQSPKDGVRWSAVSALGVTMAPRYLLRRAASAMFSKHDHACSVFKVRVPSFATNSLTCILKSESSPTPRPRFEGKRTRSTVCNGSLGPMTIAVS